MDDRRLRTGFRNREESRKFFPRWFVSIGSRFLQSIVGLEFGRRKRFSSFEVSTKEEKRSDKSIFFFSRWTSENARIEFDRIKQRFQTQSFQEMNESWTNFNEKTLSKKDFDELWQSFQKEISVAIKPIENDQIEINSYLNREQKLPFRNWNGFLFFLVQQFEKLKELRDVFLFSVESLSRTPTDEQVAAVSACRKCGFDQDLNDEYRCAFCELDKVLERYNSRWEFRSAFFLGLWKIVRLTFSLQPELFNEKQIQDEGGTPLVLFINEILQQGSLRSNESTRQIGKILRNEWNEFLVKIRLENSSARSYSTKLKDFYFLLDEMLQCTGRLTFYEGNFENRPKNVHGRFRFDASTIENERNQYEIEGKDFLSKVEKHRKQFEFFRYQQQDYIRSMSEISTDRSKCPMCYEVFGEDRPNVCFFLCGHVFCQQCTLQMKENETQNRNHRTHLKCPMCSLKIES